MNNTVIQIDEATKSKVIVEFTHNASSKTFLKDKNELLDRIKTDLERISFKASCLNFAWGWKVSFTYDESGSVFGYSIHSGFNRPDTHTGKIGRGWGRAWPISINYTDKELFMTCWMAIEQIIKHELLEAFSVDNCRVFDPHKSMADLMYPEVPDRKELINCGSCLNTFNKADSVYVHKDIYICLGCADEPCATDDDMFECVLCEKVFDIEDSVKMGDNLYCEECALQPKNVHCNQRKDKSMETEDALFKMADALIGYWSEHGSVSLYMSDEDWMACLDACKNANKARYEKELACFL
jgi:hypothetical protein